MLTTTNIEIKQIILPFDFSPSAKNALRHALVIAKKCGADITLLSVMDFYSSQSFRYRVTRFSEFELLAQEELEKYARRFDSIKECYVYEGKWSRVLYEVANHKKDAIIILGLGGKGRDFYFHGSHSYRIVDALRIPTLVVKDTQRLKDYKTITTALDETIHSREKLSYVLLMANAFEAKVSLIGLQTHKDRSTDFRMQAMMRQASEYIQHKTRYYQDKLIPSKNEVSDLVKHADEEKADLLVIMSSHEKSLSEIFSVSYARKVINQASMPVLICPVRVSQMISSVSI